MTMDVIGPDGKAQIRVVTSVRRTKVALQFGPDLWFLAAEDARTLGVALIESVGAIAEAGVVGVTNTGAH